MKFTSHSIFAHLCEAYLPEASSSLDLVKTQPGGQQVIQKLHTTQSLAHDQSYQPIAKISWSDLKDSYKGAWVIIQGDRGTGAIRASGGNTGSYQALASTGGEPRELNDSRGGNILDFLKGEIGGLRKFYVGKNTTSVRDKKQLRAKNQTGAATTQVNQDTLIKKFRPLWTRAITASIADIKGMVGTMVKNDAFEKAEKKIHMLKILERALDSIESGADEVPDSIKRSVNVAINMAASHYYPDETGEISRSRYGGGDYSAERHEGPQKLLADISAGDTKKLGTILSFFKRSLISG